MNHESIVIFTDGASRGNPGPGGFGAVVVADGQVTELGGRENRTTNNRMELTAVIESLLRIKAARLQPDRVILAGNNSSRSGGDKGLGITVYSDSSYVINGITKWVYGWQKNGWKTVGKKEVENRDLWERLLEVTDGTKIEWKRIDGHAGVPGNERCDEIATAFADGKKPILYSGNLPNYRIRNVLAFPEERKGLTLGPEKGSTLEKKRSRRAPYSYVSAVGGVIRTHKTWAECEKRVKGAHGAKYQKVFSPEEEMDLIKKFCDER